MRITLILLLSFQLLSAQESLNLELFGQFHRGDSRYSGTWSYVDADSNEYALLGAFTGTAIYSIDDPEQIEELAFIPGPNTRWREITVVGDHAYVSTDVQGSNHGMQVIDLNPLPDTALLVTNYNETFTMGHIIQKDIFSDSPYVYVAGTSFTDGVHIMDVSNPAEPVEIGLYEPGYYIHDCHVRGNIMFAAAFYETAMDIVDISDKSAPTLITRLTYSGNNTHSSSMTMDGKYLMVADEQDGLPGTMWNIEDLDDIYQVATYSANLVSLVHNPYIRDDFMFISHNTEGLRVLDVADPTVPVEVAYYDTWDAASGGFNGLWSACPYFPSGKIIGGNRHDGLYIWTFNNARAGRYYGQVRDSLSGLPIFNAEIAIEPLGESIFSDLEGNFRNGHLPGELTLEVSAFGYESKQTVVTLDEGTQENLVFELVPEGVTSTSDIAAKASITISPNPFAGQTWVDLSTFPKGRTLQLFNTTGQILKEWEVGNHARFQLEASDLPGGLYYVRLTGVSGEMLGRSRLVILD